MADTPKAIRYYTASNANNWTTYHTGSDTDVTNQWTQLTQNNGLLLDGKTVAIVAQRFDLAVLDANGNCINQGTPDATFATPLVPVQVITGATGSKAIAIPSGADGVVRITKGSAATDLTIASPVAGTDDGKRITIIDEGGHAHVITNASIGFNSKGSSGTATYGGTKGDSITVVCDAGELWVVGNIGVTIA